MDETAEWKPARKIVPGDEVRVYSQGDGVTGPKVYWGRVLKVEDVTVPAQKRPLMLQAFIDVDGSDFPQTELWQLDERIELWEWS